VTSVERYARYFGKSPQKLGPEHVREYLLHLIRDNNATTNTVLVNRAALRFVYVCTLKQKWFDEEILIPRDFPLFLAFSALTKWRACWTAPAT
jgi:hypothetical protein